MGAADRVAAAVDETRLGTLIDRLATFGAVPGGGTDRQSLTEPDLAARRHFVDLARSYGADATRDPAGNFFFRVGGEIDSPPVATGSHSDSQPIAGNLDGGFGVCAAIELLAALRQAGHRTKRPIEAVIWTNEEGCRFLPGTMGSTAFVNPTSLEGFLGSTDRDGTTFAQALGRLDALFGDVPLRPLAVPFHAFVEAHIEQGPVLEQLAVPLGVVQGIQGCRWFEVRTKGRAAHSGTTPLANKRDALMAAVTVIDRLYEMLGRGDDRLRLTVGRIVVEPNSPNVVPVSTFFTVDLRHPDESVLEEVGAAILALAGTAAGCPVTVERTMVMSPTVFDPTVVAAVDRAAAAFAPNRVALHSGAFHDSLRLNVHCPTGMIFVPSIDGISHSPAERTELAHMTLGARALAHAVVELADA